jgi:chromosome segregation ATPase
VEELFAALEKVPPTCVADDQLNTLADLCLCSRHKGDRRAIVTELKARLLEACCSYRSFEKLECRITTFRKSLCDEFDIDDTCSDKRIWEKVISEYYRKLIRIDDLDTELASEKSKVERANREIEGHKKRAESLGCRYREREAELRDVRAQLHQVQESFDRSKTEVQQRETELQELKSKVADRETANAELQLSITNLQTQLEENKALETTLQLRVEELLQAMSTTEAEARNFQQSNNALQQRLETTEQNLSAQIQALAILHEQNLTATEELTTTRCELERQRNQLTDATATVSNLELANAALQAQLDRERACTELEASKRWKARLRDFAHKHSRSSQQQLGESPSVRAGNAIATAS